MKKILFLFISSTLIAATASYKVEGMTCGVGCVNKIKSQVESLEGVKTCEVNFKNTTVVVDYDNSKINDQQIINQFNDDNTQYKFSSFDTSSEQSSATCSKPCCEKKSKSCCSKEKEKKNFFKRILNWF